MFKAELAAFGAHVRTVRHALNLTLEQAGQACDGMDLSQYRAIEAGETNITFVTLYRLAMGLGTTIQELCNYPPPA